MYLPPGTSGAGFAILFQLIAIPRGRGGGGRGALRYGLAIMCGTTLGSDGSGRDSQAKIGGR